MNILKSINFKLWLVLILTSLIPLIYSTARINFLGDMPSTWSFSIAAQIAWLNLGYEVLSEGLLIPLAFIFGQTVKDVAKYRVRVSTSLVVVVVSYLFVTFFVLISTPQLVSGMSQEELLVDKTIDYIRLESIAILIASVYALFTLVLVLKNNQKALYALLIVQTLLTLIGDSLLVSQKSYSLQLGVNGIAITNIMVNLVLSLISIKYLRRKGIAFNNCKFLGQEWIKDWFKVGVKSGLESFVRNTAFLVMILQLINQVQQSGTYWITNNFIWGWLLLPILALGQLIKQDTATNGGLSVSKVNEYFMVTFICVLLWFTSMPYWETFVSDIMGVKDAGPIVNLATLLVSFYVVFAFNNVVDSYFYGLGRTDLMLYQSLLVNTLFYGSAFLAYKVGLYTPALESIAWMFGLGLVFDAAITFGFYLWLRRSQRAEISHLGVTDIGASLT